MDVNVAGHRTRKKTFVFNLLFFKRFLKLTGFMFPSIMSVQVLLCVLLLALGLLEQVVIYNVGMISSKYYKVFGDGDFDGFKNETILALVLIVSEAFIKASGVYLYSVLYVIWRGCINSAIHKLYFKDMVYYSVNVLSEIDNPDQRITQDVDRLCDSFSQIFTPIIIAPFTIVYYLYKSVQSTSYLGPVGVLSFFFIATVINKFLMSPVVEYVFKREMMEGNFRFKHMQMRVNAESAAFYRSGDIEKIYTDKKLHKLLKTQHRLIARQYALNFSINLFDYLGSILSYLLLAFPIFNGEYDNRPASDLSSIISANSFIIIYLINNFTKLIDLALKASDVAGNAHRVGELIEELQVIKDEQDEKSSHIHQIHPHSNEVELNNITIDSSNNAQGVSKALTVQDLTYGPPKSSDILCKSLNFQLESGINVLITGDSGCGKSSLLRVIAGLWSSVHGHVQLHHGINPQQMLFLPQKPYFTDGTLKQQVIFPLQETDPGSVSNDDETIQKYMGLLGLEKLLDRAHGLELQTCCDWYNELSPGEMQRLSFVRLFFHQPKFADEATSQIGLDLEKTVYRTCSELGITLMSVGHRDSLRQYHELELHLHGKGDWSLQPIRDNEATSQIGLGLEKTVYRICSELGITVMSVGHRDSLRQYHELELHLHGKGDWSLQPIRDSNIVS